MSYPISYGAAEKADEDGERREDYPNENLACLIVFHAVEREGGERGEASAESRHGKEGKGGLIFVAPGGNHEIAGKDADEEAGDGVYNERSESLQAAGGAHCYQNQVAGNGAQGARTPYEQESEPDGEFGHALWSFEKKGCPVSSAAFKFLIDSMRFEIAGRIIFLQKPFRVRCRNPLSVRC